MEHTSKSLKLDNFSHLLLSGAEEVTGFDEQLIELSLGDETLLIGGQNLKIESFSREKREITITGMIDSVMKDTPRPQKRAKGFFSRFFS